MIEQIDDHRIAADWCSDHGLESDATYLRHLLAGEMAAASWSRSIGKSWSWSGSGSWSWSGSGSGSWSRVWSRAGTGWRSRSWSRARSGVVCRSQSLSGSMIEHRETEI